MGGELKAFLFCLLLEPCKQLGKVHHGVSVTFFLTQFAAGSKPDGGCS
jgi:hypothetical protein